MQKPNSKYHGTVYQITQKISDRTSKNTRSTHLLREAQRIEQAVKSLGDIAATKSPTETTAAHFKRVEKSSKRLRKETADAVDRIVALQGAAAQDIDNRINQRLNLTQNSYAGELRATLRGMDQKARLATVKDIMSREDGQGMAAISQAPAVLSGLTDEVSARFMDDYTRMYAADLVSERDALITTASDLSILTATADKAADGFSDPSRLRTIESEEQAAADAENAFKEVFELSE
ncbi:MAG: hypothetical protein HN944_03355 [Gammaproteobacteria bacterium]|jgi:hypothetical protein|nr:hypothetical protein [Gammaproteobacteria bacterium]MBT4132419.1 hypothetical protein [Candidatus Neomarinimicrobiota bacterium]MBT4300954.1 hypothetical protein [Gammaproteobacteria bacterium]MBT7139778.1 hypothetical protein [Gammaproteobacteria bacterium]